MCETYYYNDNLHSTSDIQGFNDLYFVNRLYEIRTQHGACAGGVIIIFNPDETVPNYCIRKTILIVVPRVIQQWLRFCLKP